MTISKDSGDWSLLNEQVLLLSKKHGQLKQAVTRMVQVVMGFLDDIDKLDVKLSVIDTLRTVTEGKVTKTALRLDTRADLDVDLCRSRARSCYSDTLQYQTHPRRPHGCQGHPLRTASGNFWVYEQAREDRIHSGTGVIMHR